MKLFWSWQSDRDPKLHHYFVRDALKDACKLIARDADYDEAQRPEVDHDTKNAIGTQDITKTILEKIAAANVFVADMTPVGVTNPAALLPSVAPEDLPDPKYLQNPNVMSELGYAERAVSQDRIVLVANSAHYPGPHALPFDWRHRSGPKTYNLPDGATKEQVKAERERFATVLKNVIAPILAAQRPQAAPPPAIVWHEESSSAAGIWAGGDRDLELRNVAMEDSVRRVSLPTGARVFVRVAPTYWTPPVKTLLAAKINRAAFQVRGSGGDWGVNGSGALAIWGRSGAVDEKVTGNATQWFQDTGELWGVSSTCFGLDDNNRPNLGYALIFKPIDSFIERAIEAINELGGSGPIGVKVGIADMRKTYFPGQFLSQASEALQDSVAIEKTKETWTDQSRREFLKDFWNAVLDGYGRNPVESVAEFERMVELTPIATGKQ
ncbi:hypothetical protein [Microvirga sp. Mcv34]|uniref:hypothetical protein n=1 Tax=Microvirga sp. Mcv34 TaxID=2926016 RepID=UPI0021C7D82A|nr:hypothetical protein [Microvirga sp. Mcv34]